MMMKIQLNTSAEIKGAIQDIPVPAVVRIPIQKKHKPVVKKKQIVGCGQVIAEISSKGAYNLGFVHASIDGMVEDILPNAIIIGPLPLPKEGEATPAPTRPAPCAELDSLSGEELCRKLLELGVDTEKLHAARRLIINGLNPEPGVIVSEQLLKDAPDTLKAGVQLLEKALNPGSITLVVAPGRQTTLHGCSTVNASDIYPATIDPLVIYAVTGAERPADIDIISILDLYYVGRVAETRLPITESIVSLGDKTFRAPVGTAIQDLATASGCTVKTDKKIALGGPMRGEAVFDLSSGISKTSAAVTVVDENSFPPVQSNPCINCGECVLACPARVQPGMLSRFSEFKLIDDARKHYVDSCLECGMCTFVCPANRPVLQYILLAKQLLAEQDAEVATCRLQD